MLQHLKKIPTRVWEVLFQASLIGMIFIFYSFDPRHPDIEEHEVALFANYVIAAFFINYYLLPRFLYRKKYLLFSLYVLLVIAVVIVLEEGVIEQIYFPDTRGTGFPGVFYNLAAAMPSITIIVGFKFAWDALTKERELEQLKNAVQESELQFLKSQINPHFLFNNLNNIYAHAVEQSEKTPNIILELSGVLRYMLYECRETYVPLQKEIDHLESFVNLHQLQLEGNGSVVFTRGNLNGNVIIAPLILPVFVENAFKHSMSSQSKDIQIKIHVDMDSDDALVFTCSNTYSKESNTDSLDKGIGLENVKRRLNMLYPDGYEFNIQENGELFEVSLLLKLH